MNPEQPSILPAQPSPEMNAMAQALLRRKNVLVDAGDHRSYAEIAVFCKLLTAAEVLPPSPETAL